MKTILLICALVLAAGCAKTGEPEPPRLLIPRTATDLSVEQYADEVILRCAPPLQNTDGSTVTTLREMEVFRLVANSDRSDQPISDETFLERADRVLIIPAQNLPEYLKSQTLVVRDDLSFLLDDLYTRGFFYAVRFINRKNQTAGLSNRVFIAPLPIPLAPVDLSARVSQTKITLKWEDPRQNMDGSTPPRVAGYNLYRSESAADFPSAPLNPIPLESPGYEDSNFHFDKTYFYAVTVVGNEADPVAKSRPSAALRVVAADTFPPSPPQNLDCVAETGVVILLWVAPPEPDVTGYRIYRMEGSAAPRSLEPELITILSYRDRGAQPGKTYRYGVTSVDRYGNESRPAEKNVEVP